MLICAAVAAVGALVALLTVGRSADEPIVRHASPTHGCHPSTRPRQSPIGAVRERFAHPTGAQAEAGTRAP